MPYAGDLTPQQAFELLGERAEAVLVDVRTCAEWNYVGVPDLSGMGKQTVLVEWVGFPDGQLNSDFLDQLAAAGVQPGEPVVFLCRSGVRSVAAANAATAAGLGPAYNVLDGFEGHLDAGRHRRATGWKAAGLPWAQS